MNRCPSCGQKVMVIQSDEGTGAFVGTERKEALEEAAKIADDRFSTNPFPDMRAGGHIIADTIRKLKECA